MEQQELFKAPLPSKFHTLASPSRLLVCLLVYCFPNCYCLLQAAVPAHVAFHCFGKSSSMYPLHPERSRLDTQMSYTYQDSTNPKTFLAMPPGYPILPILIFSLITICYFYLEQLVNTIIVTYLLVC